MQEQTVKCPICGTPYLFYPHYAGDQSACPRCREKAKENIVKPDSNKWTSPNRPTDKDKIPQYKDGIPPQNKYGQSIWK